MMAMYDMTACLSKMKKLNTESGVHGPCRAYVRSTVCTVWSTVRAEKTSLGSVAVTLHRWSYGVLRTAVSFKIWILLCNNMRWRKN